MGGIVYEKAPLCLRRFDRGEGKTDILPARFCSHIILLTLFPISVIL